jgi:hypothetical protein
MVSPPRRNEKGKFKSREVLNLGDKLSNVEKTRTYVYVLVNKCAGRHIYNA